MAACSKHGESIMHRACRYSEPEVVQFLLANGCTSTMIDAYGKSPLCDACWRVKPNFKVVSILLDSCPELVLLCDQHGAFPLEYCNVDHWHDWCLFFYNQRDRYWPIRNNNIGEYINNEVTSTSSIDYRVESTSCTSELSARTDTETMSDKS